MQGFWFGLLSQGLVLYWIAVALWHFTPLSGLAYAVTIVILAMFHAILFGVIGWIVRRTGLNMLVVFPVLWTSLEWMIGHLPQVGFPWLGLGTSLTGYPTVVQIADAVGARGVTFLLALANTALALAWLRRREPSARKLAIGVAAGIVFAAGYGLVRERTIKVRPVGPIALLQPDVGVTEKWDPAQQDSIFHATLDLSDRALATTAPRLMIWPEAAVTWLPRWPDWDEALASHAAAYGVPLVIGGLDIEFDQAGGYDYWNAAFVYDSSGNRLLNPVYHKRYLVPIVERVPFVNPRWFSGMQHFGGFGVGELGHLYDVGSERYGIIICYESAYEDLSRRYRRLGADFVVNITNDAWFGRSSAPYQHFSHLVMRAIENRVGIARSANNGISGFIDPMGRPYALTTLGDRGFVTDTLITSDARTLYTRLGDWVALFSLLGTAVLAVLAWRGRP